MASRWNAAAARARAAAIRAAAPAGATPGERALLGRTRLRLTAWSTAITLVIVLILGAATGFTVAQGLQSASEEALAERAAIITAVVAQLPSVPPELPGVAEALLPVGVSFGGPDSGIYGVLVTPTGTVLSPGNVTVAGLPDMASVEAARAGSADVRVVVTDAGPVRVLSQAAAAQDGLEHVVQVADDLTDERITLGSLARVYAFAALFALILAAVGGYLFASRALRPIQESLRRQREFAADASHELRTPLAVMRGSIEHLERHPEARVADVGDALGDMRDEVDHLIELTGSLLLLARADSGSLELDRAIVDMGDAAAAALASLERMARSAGIILELDAEPAEVRGDAVRLRQLVTILADNAIRHSPAEGTVHVGVRSVDGGAELTVRDHGRGIAPADLPYLFDRFYRAPNAPSGGTGLGLSIASRIVEAHDGTVRAESPADGGTRFIAWLPAGGRGGSASRRASADRTV
jgi:signal transduction histidine kinase